MNTTITHSGIVEKIERGHITVRIVQVSGCSTCKIAGHCNASESKEKLIDVYNAPSSLYKVGDSVVVSTSAGMGYSAVMWAFGIPLALLIGVMVAVRMVTADDARAALCGLVALIPYYIILYLLRDKFRDKFTFEITRGGSPPEQQ